MGARLYRAGRLTGLAIATAILTVACRPAYGQHITSNFEWASGSYIRARLLHTPHGSAIELPSGRLTQDDPWLAFDKVEHVTFGFLSTLGGQYVFVNKAGLSEHDALPLSVGVAASASLAKELWDLRRGTGVFSTRDLTADAVGVLLAATLILI